MGILTVLLSLLLGATIGRRLPAAWVPWLNGWVLRVALPALVLVKIPALSPDPSLLVPALTPWVRMLGAAALLPLVGRRMGWSRGTVGCLVLTAGLGNTSFVGLPLLGALRGPEALGPAVVADQLGSFLALTTAGLVVAAHYSGGRPSLRDTLLRVLRFPPLLALPIALLVGAFGQWPAPVAAVMELLAATLTPIALFVVGRRVRPRVPPSVRAPLAAGLAWALLLAPLACTGLIYLIGATGVAGQVAVLQVAMAPMVTAGIIAQEHDLDPELATAMVGVGLVLSLLTVPVWSALL